MLMDKKNKKGCWGTKRDIFFAQYSNPKWDSYKVGIALIIAFTLMALSAAAMEGDRHNMLDLTIMPTSEH